jgi:hypothetical protein
MFHSDIPDNCPNVNIKSYVLDPITVIIKLAILGNKPVGTKLFIHQNVLYFQEPGPFQSLCRYVYNTNKTDLQYLYNPIEVACQYFLSREYVQKTPRIKTLFVCAHRGMEKLMETYKHSPIIRLCIQYYFVIISNHLTQTYNETIFRKDGMSVLYTKETIESLHALWTPEKIKVILDLIGFLSNDITAQTNVKSLENIVDTIDKESQAFLATRL